MDTAYVRGKNPSPKKGVFFWYTLNIVEEVSIWEFPNILFLKDLGRFFFECFFFWRDLVVMKMCHEISREFQPKMFFYMFRLKGNFIPPMKKGNIGRVW